MKWLIKTSDEVMFGGLIKPATSEWPSFSQVSLRERMEWPIYRYSLNTHMSWGLNLLSYTLSSLFLGEASFTL